MLTLCEQSYCIIITLSVHNFINSWRCISGSKILCKCSTSSREKKRRAKDKILFFIVLFFSSTSIPIYMAQRIKSKFKHQASTSWSHKLTIRIISHSRTCRNSTGNQGWSVWQIEMQRWPTHVRFMWPINLKIVEKEK